MAEKPGTIVTYPEDLEWEAVGPLDENGKGIFVSLLYGDLKTKGPANFLMKYSAGVRAPSHIHPGDYYAVVASGKFRHFLQSEDEYKDLTAGAIWFQKGNVVHRDSCVGTEDCILNIFWPHGFDVEFVNDQNRSIYWTWIYPELNRDPNRFDQRLFPPPMKKRR